MSRRERDPLRTGYGHHRRPRRPRVTDPYGEQRRGGRLEQVADGQLGAELGPRLADQPDGEQGMAAEIEEAVGGPDLGQAQDLRKQGTQTLLLGGGRGPAGGLDGAGLGVRQGREIQLAVDGPGQRVQGEDRRRDHVVR